MLNFELFLAQAQPDGLIYWVDRVARAPLSVVLIFAVVLTVMRLGFHPLIMKTPPHKRHGFVFKAAKVANEFGDALIYAAIVVFMLLRPFAIQTFHIPTGSMIDTLLVRDMIVANKWVYRNSDPKFQDIVVFRPPQQALYEGQSQTDFIKRLIGEPGDVIQILDNQLVRNGEPVDEPYETYTTMQLGQPLEPLPDGEERNIPDFKLVEIPEDLRGIIQDEEILEAGVMPLQKIGPVVNDPNWMAPEFAVTNADLMLELWALPAAEVPEGYYLFIGDNRNGSFDSRGWGVVPRENIIGKSEFIWFPLQRIGGTN